MTTLLEQAISAAHNLPSTDQDDLARLIFSYAGDPRGVADLSQEDEAAVLRSRAAAQRGEIATDDDMRRIWAKHGL